jgi:four helix bundle protein
MLRIYQDAVEMVRDAGVAAQQIAKHDRDLTRQLRRAAVSVPLNIAEGSGVRGGNRRLRYETALGSVNEVGACLDCAEALGYLAAVPSRTRDRLRHITGVLVKVAR